MKMPLGPVLRTLPATHPEDLSDGLARAAAALRPQTYVLDAEAVDAESALRVAAGLIGRTHGLNATLVFDALRRREQAGSTALGAGFAIPHARLPFIERPVTIFIRLRDPVAFGAADGLPVNALLVIMVPRDGADLDHLRMLSLTAELFSSRGFRKRIERASTVAMAEAAFQKGIARSLRASRAGSIFA